MNPYSLPWLHTRCAASAQRSIILLRNSITFSEICGTHAQLSSLVSRHSSPVPNDFPYVAAEPKTNETSHSGITQARQAGAASFEAASLPLDPFPPSTGTTLNG